MGEEADERVGRRTHCGEVPFSRSVEEIVLDFGGVGQAVDEDIDLPKVGFNLARYIGDRVSGEFGVSFIFLHFLRYVFHLVEHGVDRIEFRIGHERPVAEASRFVEFPIFPGSLKNPNDRSPCPNEDLRPRFGERLHDRPAKSLVVANSHNQSFFSSQVDLKHTLSSIFIRRAYQKQR